MITVPPEWAYEKDAVTLRIKADPRLNLFQKNPHTLLLCIYHLRDPNGFNQLRDEKDGLQKLLECGRFDQSVAQARRIVVQPGQEMVESQDRAEGARFIAVAAGYYHMQKERATRSFSVSVQEEKREGALVQRAGKVSLDLYLGAQGIETVPPGSLRKRGKQGERP